MVAILIPRFDIPFRFDPSSHAVAQIEQDTAEDITNCVEVIMRTHPGQRLEVPDFGIADLTFSQVPVRQSDIIARISQYEPRASVILQQVLDRYDQLHTIITATVSKAGGGTV